MSINPATTSAIHKISSDHASHQAIAPVDNGLRNFFLLLRHELIEPLEKIKSGSRKLENLHSAGLMSGTPSGLQGDLTFQSLLDSARQCLTFIEKLLDLDELLTAGPIRADERIVIDELIRFVAEQRRKQATAKGVGLTFEAGRQVLAPVYGSRHWLGLAFGRLLENLIDSADAGRTIAVHARQVGRHLILSGRIDRGSTNAQNRNLLFPVQLSGPSDAKSRGEFDLSMAHAIVQLHGGMFKADLSKPDFLHQFTLTLPTGQPAVERRGALCSACPIRKQSVQYANDLAELMARESSSDHEGAQS